MDAVDRALTNAGSGASDGWSSVGDESDDQNAPIPSAWFLWEAGDPP